MGTAAEKEKESRCYFEKRIVGLTDGLRGKYEMLCTQYSEYCSCRLTLSSGEITFHKKHAPSASPMGTLILFHLSCYHLASSGSHLASLRLPLLRKVISPRLALGLLL
ncbi:hypothetical protein ACLB2K_047188 [Fragaria x ananassa]